METVAYHTDGLPLCFAYTAEEWRLWLNSHHNTTKAVWLVYHKPATGKTRVSYDDAVDEAICFGWIDSKPNKLDSERSIQYFAPRNPKSNWSQLNKRRVERLLAAGKMTASGLAAVDAAKHNGTWDALNDVDALVLPNDLETALKQHVSAWEHFSAFPKSSKKNILEWIHNAKQPTTREKRIKETAELAAQNIRANHYRQPGN
jgi:uncharacterized protein YdeI (YjbR/CyaY-like superfamily)